MAPRWAKIFGCAPCRLSQRLAYDSEGKRMASGDTGNVVPGNRLRVRISCPPPRQKPHRSHGLWGFLLRGYPCQDRLARAWFTGPQTSADSRGSGCFGAAGQSDLTASAAGAPIRALERLRGDSATSNRQGGTFGLLEPVWELRSPDSPGDNASCECPVHFAARRAPGGSIPPFGCASW